MWQITAINIKNEEGKEFESYGIKCGITCINDISADRLEMESFVELLNRLSASELHAYDLVEDFLGK